MKKLVTVLFVVAACSIQAASLRTPQMPRGLSADKTAAPLPTNITISDATTKKKKKQKGLQKRRRHVTFSEMSFDELKEAKLQKVKEKNWDIAAKYIERMIKLCDQVNEKAELIIELADILFGQSKFDDASKWYTDFTLLYPGNPRVEYASYKMIVCASKQILSIDRDQSATEKALSLAQDFLKRDLFTTYTTEVAAIQKICQETLAQSDCYVAEFYLTHKSYAAAERRLTNLRTDWVEKVPEIKAPLANLEVALAQEYPAFKVPQESIVLAEAVSPVKKVDMTARF